VHAREYQEEQHLVALDAGEKYAPFSSELLENLRKCLKVIMVSLMERTQLRRALKSRLERAETVNIMVQVCIFNAWLYCNVV
jgi:hypothetical protein